MVRRSAAILIGAATFASFAAGWWAGLAAKDRTTATPPLPVPAAAIESQPVAADADVTFHKRILPFVNAYCMPCHSMDKASGGLSLEGYQSEAHARKSRKDWAAVQEVLADGRMPPKKHKAQPSKTDRTFVVEWIESTLTKVDCGQPDPGRVTLRRLNRAEYNNTIRDLCGVDFKPADDFPSDDVGYGFDNIGDVLSFQPILLEKYMTAADKVLKTALKIPPVPVKDIQVRRPQQISAIPRSAKVRDTLPNGRRIDRIRFNSEGSAFLPENYNFPAEGEYIIRFRGWGTKVGGDFPKVTIRVDSDDVKTFSVEAGERDRKTYEARGKFKAGGKRISIAFTNGFEDKKSKESREFGLDQIEIEGPINPVPPPEPESVKKLLIARPGDGMDARTAAEKVLSNFARRAYRRPVQRGEIERLLRLFEIASEQGEPFEVAIRLPMMAVLVSPHFLYRIEDDPKDPEGIRTLDDFEFSTRLSYFLWSSMPDEELFGLAEKGKLREPAVLEAQVRRMLSDPKAAALTQNFAAQWLQLRDIKTLAPDKGFFPQWDEKLQEAIPHEAELFFEYVVQNDRSILDFLDADYTFVNGRLAEHYGIEDIYGSRFRKVKLPNNRRGGIITMASTLMVTSNPTRTSPVKRGKWILENILGTPPPPPAPDVPELPPTGQLKGTLRQQMEQHRANPTCAACHAKLDPLGFGLENFDGIGGWRAVDNKQPIDASGVLPDGAKFDGPGELRKVLLGKADQFRRCFAEKLLTFALGRGLEYYDKCALDAVVSSGKSQGDRFTAYVLAIVKSDPFQKRKGKRSE